MNTQETYLFDLQGFITVPDALTPDQVATLNAIWDKRIARDMPPNTHTMRWGGLFTWSQAHRDLLDNPRIVPYVEALVGPRFRLDHEYGDVIRPASTGAVKGPIGTTLHGGCTPFDPSQYYHVRNDRMYNGLIVVAYTLCTVNEDDGGFGCVPGSHKSNFTFPTEWRELDTLQPFMRAVTGPAGTAIIFTEALTHGTLPWRGAGERRTLFFKFSPHPISWSATYYRAEDYDGLTEQQVAILEPPNARYNNRQVKWGR